jgi:hypothetical protein
MRSSVSARIATALLLFGLAVRADGDDDSGRPPGDPPTGWTVRDVPDPFEGTWPLVTEPTALALRVVDQQGNGIRGARIYYVGEATHPLSRLVNEKDDTLYGPTDEWGRLRIEEHEVSWDHMLVLAEGYAAGNEWRGGFSDFVCRLARGEDLPVAVFDPLERPVANALVGYRLYCGHTPDVRQATTDAQGRAVLPHIDRRDTKWLWPVGESIAAEDFEAGEGQFFSRRGLVLRPDWGAVCEGTVVDANGAPVAGAAVGGRSWDRGPWTFTDASGAFRLLGFAPYERIDVDPDDDTYGGATSARAVAVPGVPLRVRLPAKDGTSVEAQEPEFPVQVRSADPTRPLGDLDEVISWRKADGRVGEYGHAKDGTLDIALAAGMWVVRVEGRPESGGSGEIVVEVSGPTEVKVPREAVRTLRVDASSLQANDQVRLSIPRRSFDVTKDARNGVIVLPAEADAVLRIARSLRVRSIPVPAAAAIDAPPLQLLPPAPTTVTARLRGPDDSEVEAGVRLDTWLPTYLGDEDEDLDVGALPIVTDWVGLGWFVARPKDAKLAGVAVEVDLGHGELPTIDLGELRFPERSTLVVSIEVPAGVAAEETLVEAVIPNIDWGWRSSAAAEAPIALPFALPSGSVLVGHARNCLPARVPIEHPGPYRVAWPKGALEVIVPTANGEILDDVQVLLDGERFEAGPARRVVWVGGIAAGEHRVLLSAPGRKAREYSAVWADGETKWLSADLPSR